MTFDYKAFADKARWRTMNDMTGGDYEEHLARVAYEAALKDRDVVLEEAAKACEDLQQIFLSEEYAVGQPLSSIQERFACGQCAEAIRNLKERV